MKNILFFALSASLFHSLTAEQRPNIIYILADDLGYGDVQCLNPKRGKIPTPHMDQVAKDGMTFTDAHTSSSVCTPTRYSILTGRYNWRTKLQKHVLNGYGSPLISEEIKTVPEMLRENGYQTAMIGKWHLGLGISTLDSNPAQPQDKLAAKKEKGAFDPSTISNIDWNGEIHGGPVDIGFDKWYGIPASLDFPPYVWIRDKKWQGVGNHVKAFHRNGPASESFEAIGVLDKLAEESVKFIAEYDSDKPFFAYIPLPSPHTPIVPTAKWQGKSGINSYADFVMQTDDFVGQITEALEKKGLAENTILMVTSDNGCSPQGGFKELEEHGHFASAQFRGAKADIWEGGHRVPFLVKWPKVIKPSSVSDTLTCQIDLMATCADLLGIELAKNEAVDSESILPVLKGEQAKFSRKGIVHHSVSGHFAYREGEHKLILAYGSGGWMAPKENVAKNSNAPKAQLYNLTQDSGEEHNLYLEKPELAAQLLKNLSDYVYRGSSVKGKDSKNDVADETIQLWKTK